MMKLSGLQKVTLLDYPGKVAATVFFGGCNFRCPYCHNASLVENVSRVGELQEEEFFSFLGKRKGLLDGVCITGGEPLLQEGLAPFLTRIKALGFLVKLDTNGSDPARLKALVGSGLADYVAMDLKNSPAKYLATAGVSADVLPAVRESAAYLLTAPVDYEFRTTLVRTLHTVEDVGEIARWIRGANRYFLQNFEDSGDILRPGLEGFSLAEMDLFAKAAQAFVPLAQVRNP
jgi:pyruvate formate lyase activating enzyme